MEALVRAANELQEQDDAVSMDPLEVSDLFLKQLKAKLKGWKVYDWDFLSRKAGTLELYLRADSPDGKVKKQPHASIEAHGGKFSASFATGRKDKSHSVKGTSLKDIISKIVAGMGSALSGLKEDVEMEEGTIEEVLSQILNFCTEHDIELESEYLDDLVGELEEWAVNPDLTEDSASALRQFVERLKKMIFTMLDKSKKTVTTSDDSEEDEDYEESKCKDEEEDEEDEEGDLPGDAGDAGEDGEDDEDVDEARREGALSIRPLVEDLRTLTEKEKPEKWIQKMKMKKGALRKALHVKKGETIPAGKLKKAAEKPGKMGKRARLAMTLRSLRK